MKIGMNLEIHFHQQDEVSIFLESNTKDDDEKFGEILLFCCVTLRILINFGDDYAASSLAELLEQAEGSLTKEFINYKSPEDAELVDYKGAPGRKRFEAQLKFSGLRDDLNFQFHQKGFGLFASGIGYYAPTAVTMLLKYLAKKRIKDEEFLSKLGMAAKMCGKLFNNGDLSFDNQHSAALIITNHTHAKDPAQNLLLTTCIENIQNLNKIISKNFENYIEGKIDNEVFAQFMKGGYALRYTEQKLANGTLKKISDEINKILESGAGKEMKIEEISNYFDNHTRIDLGELVKPYCLSDYDEVNKVFICIVETFLNRIMDNVADGNEDMVREFGHRNAAFGYYYRVAEDMIEGGLG